MPFAPSGHSRREATRGQPHFPTDGEAWFALSLLQLLLRRPTLKIRIPTDCCQQVGAWVRLSWLICFTRPKSPPTWKDSSGANCTLTPTEAMPGWTQALQPGQSVGVNSRTSAFVFSRTPAK